MASFFSRLRANKHFQNGVPFFLFIGGGAFALKEFRTVRYDSNINIRLEEQLIQRGGVGVVFRLLVALLFTCCACWYLWSTILQGQQTSNPRRGLWGKGKGHWLQAQAQSWGGVGRVKGQGFLDIFKPTVDNEFIQVDIDNWENKRGPRPWEDSRTFQAISKKLGFSLKFSLLQGAPPAKPKKLLPEMVEKWFVNYSIVTSELPIQTIKTPLEWVSKLREIFEPPLSWDYTTTHHG